MAIDVVTSTNQLTNKRWSKLFPAFFMQETWAMRMASKSDTGVVLIMQELQKHSGDAVTFGVRGLLQGRGVQDLNALTGNEETGVNSYDTLAVHELAHATVLQGPISNQRVLYNRRMSGRSQLTDWYAARADHSVFNQTGGYNALTDTAYTGNMATTAPTSGRQILPDGVPGGDPVNLTPLNTFTLNLWDKGKLQAKSLTKGIRPAKFGGRALLVGILHPSCVADMRTSAGVGQWLDIQRAAMTGGDIGDNPIFWESLGQYNGILMHESSRITNAVSLAGAVVANTKRAQLLGAQAATMAFGRMEGNETMFVWLEELRDFGRQMGIGISSIWGIKKTSPTPVGSGGTAVDFAAIAIDTYGIDIDPVGTQATMAL